MGLRPIYALLLSAGALCAQLTPQQKTENLESFEVVWRTVRDQHPDRNLNGLNWQAIHDSTRPLISRAESMEEVREILRAMLAKLNASHYSIIPSAAYKPAAEPARAPDSSASASHEKRETQAEAPPPASAPAAPAETQAATRAIPPEGTLVHFGNLPETRLFFDSRTLPGGAGYIRFNEFLDPATIMPQFEAAVKQFSKAPGIILDLRGNPGGIGIMAMGIAGFFIDKPGLKLGEMRTREATLKFAIFPRPETYAGRLAILVDERSASTTEILAGGLQDLKRARIFGTRTAGAALPSDIIRLPNGDGFQYAEASYTSTSGTVLEGNGVTPDVIVRPDREVSPNSHDDAVIRAANEWILSARR